MPPEMAVSMRHTKIKAEEAALLAGELKKPTWESRNEGIHERVSFEDTIWGFDLAGGAYYQTPLRVTFVKPDSRAEKAGIRPGDKLKRINDIDTSTLTIQQAHDIIVESGIHLKLAVTAPEDEEDAYYCYEDPVEDGYDSEEERLREEEKARKRQVHARVSSYWSLQWPWVSKRRIIYRESNCFMVPSKFEENHRDKFPVQPSNRIAEDIVLDSLSNLKLKSKDDGKTELQRLQERLKPTSENEDSTESNIKSKEEDGVNENDNNINNNNTVNETIVNGHVNEIDTSKQLNGLGGIIEEEESIQDVSEMNSDNSVEDNSLSIAESTNEQDVVNGDVEEKDDKVIEELLNGHSDSVSEEEEKVLDNILSDEGSHMNGVAYDR